jgi:rhodanese-related sulfurtransferase
MRLGRIGLDSVAGYIGGGMKAFNGREDLVKNTDRVTPEELSKLLKSDKPPYVVDVRSPGEWDAAHIDKTHLLPLSDILDHVDSLPKDKEIIIMCASGNRSSTAASLLSQRGVTHLTDLRGGIEGWQDQKMPVISGAPHDDKANPLDKEPSSTTKPQ